MRGCLIFAVKSAPIRFPFNDPQHFVLSKSNVCCLQVWRQYGDFLFQWAVQHRVSSHHHRASRAPPSHVSSPAVHTPSQAAAGASTVPATGHPTPLAHTLASSTPPTTPRPNIQHSSNSRIAVSSSLLGAGSPSATAAATSDAHIAYIASVAAYSRYLAAGGRGGNTDHGSGETVSVLLRMLQVGLMLLVASGYVQGTGDAEKAWSARVACQPRSHACLLVYW